MILVAGHLCLDVFPALASGTEIQPGVLIEAGPVKFTTGGAVSNVGVSLHKLGASVRLVGKVGDDPFGKIVLDLLRAEDLTDHIQIDPTGDTSYTIVISPPGRDRTFLHCPGCNDSFVASDVPESALIGAKHLHFGYPPLMAAMSANGGEELESLFRRAKAHGLTTSLDMSLPDPDSKQSKVNWTSLLKRILPFVDVFLPSEDELDMMLPGVQSDVEVLAFWCTRAGAKAVCVKRGAAGLYGLDATNSTYQPCFKSHVVDTTGSGDATIAGFLYAYLADKPFAQCLEAGCAVGAFCVEEIGATTGIPAWPLVQERIEAGQSRK
ncbi:MAG: carbohydrate kinase family protein [Armatimonadetes bacterium]|nr:carbohydrate kinase family protein [Armatimonadota bacterium]